MQDKIKHLVRAGFAGIYMVTPEEARAENDIRQVARELEYSLFSWSITGGLLNPEKNEKRDITDPMEVIDSISDLPEKSIIILKDFHAFLDNTGQPPNPYLVRSIREEIREARTKGKVLLILGCQKMLPPEIEKEFTVVEAGLPDKSMLKQIASGIAESAGMEAEDGTLNEAADAARGLTTVEAEDIMAYSVVETGNLDSKVIAREKANAVAESGMLEIVNTKAGENDIGGLESLRSWLGKRRNAFSDEAREFGLPVPKGAMILGVPGTGKSLTAKVTSSILGRPILRLDAGKLFAGIVGKSEGNLRQALQVAEAVAPCILWIDEIEKGFSGSKSSGSTDGGTSSRVFGSFVSWMQEKTSPVFVVATANDVSQLPPELLRKGRFDELFFVDLPGEDEREAIWRIHIRKRDRNPEQFDLYNLVKLSDGFTGSEIEQAVIDALFECFDDGKELDDTALTEAVKNTVPLSVTGRENVESLRRWAASRARPASSKQDENEHTRRIAA